MPFDMTHCDGQHCPLKENCLRYTAVSYGKRDFFGTPPYNLITCDCQHYWDDRPSEANIRQLAYQLWEKSGCESGNALHHWLQAQQLLIYRLRNS
jgi:hypothetical protein